MEFGLKTFIGQKDEKLKDVRKKGVARPVFKNERFNLRNNSIFNTRYLPTCEGFQQLTFVKTILCIERYFMLTLSGQHQCIQTASEQN